MSEDVWSLIGSSSISFMLSFMLMTAWLPFAPKRAGELARSVLAPEKAAEQLGWRAAMPLERGVAETYAWFASKSSSPVTAK